MSHIIRVLAVAGASALAIAASNGKMFVGCAGEGPADPAPGVKELSGVAPDPTQADPTRPIGQQSCNGPRDEACPPTYYCHSLSCNSPGQCLPRPESCTGVDTPVCGCDGKTYPSLCEAHRAGTGLAADVACGPVPYVPSPATPPTHPTVLPNQPSSPPVKS